MAEKRRETLPRKSSGWVSKRTLRTLVFVVIIVIVAAWFLSSKSGGAIRDADGGIGLAQNPTVVSNGDTNEKMQSGPDAPKDIEDWQYISGEERGDEILVGDEIEGDEILVGDEKEGDEKLVGDEEEEEEEEEGEGEEEEEEEEKEDDKAQESQGNRPIFNEASGELEWWQKEIIYQVYPRSFQDSDGDGVGDLKGLRSKLDYIHGLGATVIWLCPVYESPMKDFGYDVTNFTAIHEVFGSLADFDDLVKDMKKKDMKLLMDYVPNHTSDQHMWFKGSLKGGEKEDNPYTDFYIWDDGKKLSNGTIVAPNNWVSIYGYSAWTWSEERKQYYYHHYLIQQPDLDWRNEEVQKEMLEVLKFWLKRGVAGFRLDAISKLYEDATLRDEPFQNGTKKLDHIYTRNQPEICDIVKQWRKMFVEYENGQADNAEHIFMVAEIYDQTMVHAMKYYDCGADAPYNTKLLYVSDKTNGDDIYKMVNSWLSNMPKGKWPTWATGNHDRKRIADLKSPKYVDAFNALLLLLPGTPTTYQGEELGMRGISLTFNETKDFRGRAHGEEGYKEYSRDPSRGPMQWSNESNAGFSEGKPWLPVHPDFKKYNVKVQEKDKTSPLGIYKQLTKLRRNPAFQKGSMTYCVHNKNIFSFVRRFQNEPAYLVAINFGDGVASDDYWTELSVILGTAPTDGEVVFSTSKEAELTKGTKLNEEELKNLSLKPAEVVIVQLSVSTK